MTMMDAALKYVEANIPVIPLHWICEDGSCSCKLGQQCGSKGKRPLYSGWYKNSTADVEQIKKWWTKTPNVNIGISTSEKSGWLVLDVDDSENTGRLKAIIDVASNLEGLIIMPDELDADIWKLNCKNGVVDLKTGKLLPHKREYYMSKICPVEFIPNSKAPRWMEFLNTITGGSSELVKYLQKAVGSSLSRDISEQALFVLYGTGANGKSTFLNTISDLYCSLKRKSVSYSRKLCLKQIRQVKRNL